MCGYGYVPVRWFWVLVMCGLCSVCVYLLPSGFILVGGDLTSPMYVCMFCCVGFGFYVMFGLCIVCVALLPSGFNHIGGDLASPMCVGMFQFVVFGS